MEKFTLSEAGFKGFTTKLYRLTDDSLQTEARLLANDPISYLAEHFELQIHHLEFLRNSNQEFTLVLGYSMAIALLVRRQINLLVTQDFNQKKIVMADAFF